MLIRTGIPEKEQIDEVFPEQDRLEKGPCAVIECFQNIPCNPCASACRRNAIKPFENINNLPIIDRDKCNGCTICVSKCPGLAIMVVDYNYSDTQAVLKIPYEFLPLPHVGEVVDGLDREGKSVCKAEVVKVLNTKAMDKTPVISIAVPKEFIKVVRNIGMGV